VKNKKTVKIPKPRHAWAINPKTRVKKSAKKYSRSKAKQIEKDWADER
jgi:hypothetical protein